MGMEGKEKSNRERIEAVLQILRKQAPLTVKQEKFCNDACVERFLRGKGNSVKKAAKHIRTVFSWRDSIGTDHLTADEFSEELAEGMACVAGHDDEARPVLVFRIKQDYPKFHSQKLYVGLLVFTMEVAISSMSRFVDQFVLLFDASFFRSASAFLNMFMGTLKIISDYYPGRLHKAFVVDPPSLFSYLWKGVRPFVELSTVTMVVSSLDFRDSLGDESFASYPKTSSLRFDPGSKIGGSTSYRFSFTVSHLDSLKPWYLNTLSEGPISSSLMGVSPLNARSFSFASPSARSTPRGGGGGRGGATKNIPSTTPSSDPPPQQPRTPRPSFLQSPAMLFSSLRKEGHVSKGRESFLPYLRFYRRPYDERVYRSKMRAPHGGLISIVSPQVKRRHFTHHSRDA